MQAVIMRWALCIVVSGPQELQLSGNCLEQLPEEISRLTALRRLGLAGNLLTHLPPDIGALTCLEGLWLHGNLLTCLPQQLSRLGALRTLSLAGTRERARQRGLCSGSGEVRGARVCLGRTTPGGGGGSIVSRKAGLVTLHDLTTLATSEPPCSSSSLTWRPVCRLSFAPPILQGTLSPLPPSSLRPHCSPTAVTPYRTLPAL